MKVANQSDFVRLSYQGLVDGIEDEAYRQGLAEIIAELGDLYAKFSHAAAAIGSDPNLTVMGKKTALAKLGRDAVSAINTVMEKYIPGLTATRQQFEKTMQPRAVDKDDRVVQLLRHQELRSLIRQQDALQVEMRYREAVQSGNTEFCDAVEQAPDFPPLVKKAVLDELAGYRLASQFPESYGKWRDVSEMIRSIRLVTQNIMKDLSKAGLQLPDAIAEMAGGKRD